MTNLADYNQNYISSAVGNAGNYRVNTRTGRLDFEKSVASFNGSLLSEEIYFVYNPFHEGTELAAGFPVGWKLNIHQRIDQDGDNYIYVDSKGHDHIFNKLTDVLYYDTSHSGLLLRVDGADRKITDDRNYSLYFNTVGMLTKIEECKGADVSSIQITYLNGRITKIQDGMGRDTTVSYVGSSVTVTTPDGAAIKLEIKNGNAYITDKNDDEYEYVYVNSDGKNLLGTINAAGGESTQFFYDASGRVISVKSGMNGIDYSEDQLSYNSYYTIIGHINNKSTNSVTSYRTADIFALNGEYVSSNEVSSDDEIIMRLFKSKEAYSEYMLNLSGSKFISGKIAGSTTYNFSNNGGSKSVSGEFSSAISVGVDERCAISMQLYCNLSDAGKHLTVRVERTNNAGVSILEEPFTITLGGPFTMSYAAALNVSGSLSGIKFFIGTDEKITNVKISNVRIGVTKKNGYVSCIDGSSGNVTFTEKNGNTTKVWRKISDCTLKNVTDCERMTHSDWLLSKDNAARAGAGNSFVIWYNDLGGAILANSSQIVTANGQDRAFSAINYARVSLNRALTVFEYVQYNSAYSVPSSGKDAYRATTMFMKEVSNYVRSGAGKICTAEYNIYGLAVKTADSSGVTSVYSYDGYGRQTGSTVSWQGGSAVKSVSYSAIPSSSGDRYTETVTESGKSMVYTYDYATGNLISVQDGKGNELEYGYDALERMNLLKGSAGSAVNKNELTYSGSDITVMKHSGAQYNIAYDNKKHIKTFKVGTSNYITTENAQYKMHGEFLTYNYSDSNVTQYADKYGRMVKEVWSGGGQRCYCYGTESESMSGVTASNFENRDINSAGKLRKVIDGSRNIVYTYTDGEIDGIEYSDGNEYGVERDQYGRIMTETIKAGGTTYSVTYMYQDGDAYNGDRLTTYLVSAGGKVCISGLTYDELGRMVSQSKGTLSGSAGNTVTQEQYAYGNADVTQVSKITYGDGATSTYSYDACGNITQVSGKETVKYSYDGLNRLVREDNAALNKSYTYSYDAGGNITAKKEYAYTTGTLGAAVKTYNYVYGSNSWKDKLTSWNGQSITYDSYGNVKSYKGATYTWDRLNRLKSCVKSNSTAEYTYNAEGQPEKTELDYGNGMVGTTEREYVNGRLYKESKILTMNGAEIVSATMQYLYRDEEVIGLIYNGSLYYYRKNLQGDIIEIVDEDGNVAATYKYDAWGNWAVSGGDVGTYNSFRYRGYYYDTAIMLYYLKTRWYDPETGRFISPDSINYLDPQSINGLNLYAYCLNNPVMGYDPDGTLDWWQKLLIGAAFILVGAAVTAATAGTGTGLLAAFGAALLTSAKAVAVSTAISAGIGFVVGGISSGSFDGAVAGLLNGAVDGFMWGGIFAGGSQILSAGFKGLAQLGIPTGRKGGIAGTGILSPDKLRSVEDISKIAQRGQAFYDYGGTILKFGKYAHVDVSTKSLLHLHLWFTRAHLPLGTILAGFIGGF